MLFTDSIFPSVGRTSLLVYVCKGGLVSVICWCLVISAVSWVIALALTVSWGFTRLRITPRILHWFFDNFNCSWKLGICCWVISCNNNNTVRRLHNRQGVNNNADWRCIENNVVVIFSRVLIRSNMDSLERSSDGFGGIAPYVIALRFSIFVSFTISSSEHSSLR